MAGDSTVLYRGLQVYFGLYTKVVEGRLIDRCLDPLRK